MSERADSVIELTGVTKVFRDFWLREKVTAVSSLDLQIRPGEVFGLLGPNGSGKTTTLKMILGLLFPTRGRIMVFGKRPADVGTKRRIGFLPEDSYLYPFLDARETLDYYGRLFEIPARRRGGRIDMLLEMVGLSGVAYRRVAEYSKGMQRRIGLAQALINDPDLLILDEPTSGMDPVGARQFKDLIRTLARRGKTVLLSSHLLADVEDVCDRICILYGGRERALGRVDELLGRQSETQIVTDQLDEATLERVCEVIDRANKSVRAVSAPRDRLESLFLRIVEEAQRQRAATGGAVATGQVAEFLRKGDEGRELIEQLVEAARPEEVGPEGEPQPEAEPAEAPAQPIEEVLATLTQPESPAEPPPLPPPVPRRPSEQVDQNIIDDLIRRGDEGKNGTS